jgi:putative endonuclease
MALAVTTYSGCGGGLPEMGREDYTRQAPGGRRGLVSGLVSGLQARSPMSSRARVILGKWAEDRAADELAHRGYAILARRYRTRGGEIDIVARDGQTLVFVEVKARRSLGCGQTAEAVTRWKNRRIVSMAQHFLTRHRLHGRACRFDVVSVLCPEEGPPVMEVVRDAFQAS